MEQDLQSVVDTLGIKPGKNGELTLVFGALPRNAGEIALLSRSMLEILLEVASGIEVPNEHVSEGLTSATTRLANAANPLDRPLITIHSTTARPSGAFATVHYHDTWYWISDGDLNSESIFTFLMIFFSLAETGVTPQTPVLTVPAS
jgi:hypothetical protein